ncbi:MAG: CBS domain-containing protein [Phycisphaerae bacterium]
MPLQSNTTKQPIDPHTGAREYQLFNFSELMNRPVCAGKIKDKIGKLSDLVFRLSEPYPEAIGIFIEHGWGKPTEFVPWEKVTRIEDDAIFVTPPEGGGQYPPFVDQPGWLLVNEHLMGRTILDMDGRRVEVVNDVHLLVSKGRMLILHVDISFNGFLRRWGLGRFHLIKDHLISWKYVQPLSVEDTTATDAVSLSVTRNQIMELPSEDLADVLEELTGEEQQAVFSALDSEKAAETLMEAEPRAQRQLIANLRKEKARTILSEMSIPQLADLFSVLPHDDMKDLMELLPKDVAERIDNILSEQEATARNLMSSSYVAVHGEMKVAEAITMLRSPDRDPDSISYLYIINPERVVLGIVDLRDLVLASPDATLAEIMASPVVSAEEDDVREDLTELFAKYHYRMIPVVDVQDHLLGVIKYKDIMKGLVTRAKM